MHTFCLFSPQQGQQSERSQYCWQEKQEESVSCVFVCACMHFSVSAANHQAVLLLTHVFLFSWRTQMINYRRNKSKNFLLFEQFLTKKIQLAIFLWVKFFMIRQKPWWKTSLMRLALLSDHNFVYDRVSLQKAVFRQGSTVSCLPACYITRLVQVPRMSRYICCS